MFTAVQAAYEIIYDIDGTLSEFTAVQAAYEITDKPLLRGK